MSGISIGNRLTILPSTHGLSVGNGLYFSTGGGPVPPILDYWINNRQREASGAKFSYKNYISFDSAGNIIVSSSGLDAGKVSLAYFNFSTAGNLNYGKFILSGNSIVDVIIYDDGISAKIAIGYNVTNSKLYVSKINSSNQIVWQNDYFDPSLSPVPFISRDAKIVSGGSVYISGDGINIIKIDNDGSQSWAFAKKINAGAFGTFPVNFVNIQIEDKSLAGSSIYLIGNFNSQANMCVVKMSSLGAIQSTISVLTPSGASPAFAFYDGISAVAPNGYLSFAVNPSDIASGRYFGYIVNLNNSLQFNWVTKILGGNSDQEVYTIRDYSAMCFDASGNWYIVCQYYDYITTEIQTLLMKIDGTNNLNILWQRKIIFGDNLSTWQSQPRAIALDENENIILSLNVSGPSSSFYDFVLKLPSDGSKTGSYVVGGVDVLYSASSFAVDSSTFSSEEFLYVESDFAMSQIAQSNTISSISSTDSVVSI